MCLELSELGFDSILLESVQFPTGYGLEVAYYPYSDGISKDEVLISFTEDIYDALSEQQTSLVVTIPAAAAVGYMPDQYGVNPFEAQVDYYAIDVRTSTIGYEFALGDTVLTANDLPTAVETILRQAVENAETQGFEGEFTAIIDSGIPEVVVAAKNAGTEHYVMYTP